MGKKTKPDIGTNIFHNVDLITITDFNLYE